MHWCTHLDGIDRVLLNLISFCSQAQHVALSRSDQEKNNAEDEVKEEVKMASRVQTEHAIFTSSLTYSCGE